jgi:hypothetical protein
LKENKGAQIEPSGRHLTDTIGLEISNQHCEGNGTMTYDADTTIAEFVHLRLKQRRYAERSSSSQEVLPAVRMLIGDWYVDELGIMTREIRARD